MKSVNESNPLISVIVPVYNVEPYLDQCVQSIVNQTYRNLEIILVDDGSPDNCPQMCDAWAERDGRIRVIHKANGGLSDARNAGMAVVTGELIGFVDSDDWIRADMYQLLYKNMQETDSDIASCGAKRVWLNKNNEQELLSVNRDCVFERTEAMEALLTANGLVQTVWNKLYRKNVIDGVLFLNGIIHEDEFWSWQVIARARRVVTIKESCYYYLQRDNSIMGAGFSEKGLLVIRAKAERQDYIENSMPQLKDIGRADIVYTCMHLGIQVLKTKNWNDGARLMKFIEGTVKSYPIGNVYLGKLAHRKRLHLRLLQSLFIPICMLHSIKH